MRQIFPNSYACVASVFQERALMIENTKPTMTNAALILIWWLEAVLN